jgi:hypothetical protein
VTAVLIDQVRSALDELSDLEYQSRVWTGRGARGEMSSFVECVERLFDDSGLELALEAGEPVFGPQIDEKLREFGDLLVKIDGGESPDELISHPKMRLARDRAAAILRAIDEETPNARD